MEQGKKVRESGIELLRILMMMQVIFLHIVEYGGYREYAVKAGGNTELVFWLIWTLSRCPVYVFIVLVGYYQINKDVTLSMTFKRIRSTYVAMLFYSIGIPLVTNIIWKVPIDNLDTWKAFLPFLSRTWYFMTLYLLTLFFVPYLNRSLQTLSKKEYTTLLVALFFIFSVWQLFGKVKPYSDVISVKKIISTDGGKSLYSFLYMYILGGYLRRFVPEKKKFCWRYLAIFLLLGVVNATLVYQWPGYNKVVAYNDNLFSVLQCVMLVLFFRQMHFRSKLINAVAINNNGVYMIHEHYLARGILWGELLVLKGSTLYQQSWFGVKILYYIVLIYICCAAIEFARKKLFDGIGLCYEKIKSQRVSNVENR